jgi:hypothetical protein
VLVGSANLPWKEVIVLVFGCEPFHIRDDWTYLKQPVQVLDCKEQVLQNKAIPFEKVVWQQL